MTTQGFGFDRDIARSILDENPQTAFFSFQNQFGQSPNQRRFIGNQFQDIHNQFLGMLGQQLRGGETPDLRFTDFLGDFNFNEQFRSFSPTQRGQGQRNFSPRTRFLPF